MLIAALVPGVSSLTAAVVLGIVAGNFPRFLSSTRPGLAWVTRSLLRIGVVLLGLQLAVGQVLGLGAGVVVAVCLIVGVTLCGTLGLAKLLGVRRGLAMLVATGFSICGASAIAAVEGVVDREDEDVATSVAMVTIFGTASMLVLPVLATEWGLLPDALGRWAGGSVHEVSQVIATASPVGGAAVGIAVVVKLSRVVLLAPVVAAVSLGERRRTSAYGQRPPIMPLFVVGFLAAVCLRSTGFLPAFVLGTAQHATTLLLTGAMFGLGTTVRFAGLVRTGPRALVLGACSTLLVSATAFVSMALLA
jgi:uncharacterized integral membrane protein (TIGR00698 family)